MHNAVFFNLLESDQRAVLEPFDFQPYHQLIRKPFDYYQFGIDLVKPLVDFTHSTVIGLEHHERRSPLP